MNSDIFLKAKKHFLDGLKLFQNENYNLAEKKFLLSLELIPNRLSTIDNLLKIYIKTDNKEKLADLLKKSQEFKHDKIILAGTAYKDFLFGNYDSSIEICNKLIEEKYLEYQFLDLKASNFKKQKKFFNVIKIYKHLLFFKEKEFLTLCNIGRLFYELGKIHQAKFFFDKSKKIKSNYIPNLWHLSLCNLTQGNLKDGFFLYENRWEINENNFKKFQHINELTNLSNIQDKKILIWDEQGLGDTIHFSRFVIDLLEYTKTITFAVNSKLKDLLNHLHLNIDVVEYDDVNKKDFDFQLSVCSLPRLLKISSIKDISFYKLLIPNKNEKIKNFDNSKLNIGIAWFGNNEYIKDEYRSISFDYFDNILNLKNTNFYKLNKGFNKNEFQKFRTYENLYDYGDRNFFDLCYLINKLDLVISSDTSIIHLCGTLGIKCILLLNYNADWRWFSDDKITAWYPSVEIIRQKKFNDWNSVFEILEKKIELIKKKD